MPWPALLVILKAPVPSNQNIFFFNAAGMSSSANCYQLQEESLLFTEQIHKKQNEKFHFPFVLFMIQKCLTLSLTKSTAAEDLLLWA